MQKKTENNNKCKTCTFFVVWGDGEALSSMPDIELLNILNINCNTIGAENDAKGMNCNVNKDGTMDAGSKQFSANIGLERSCTKTNSNADCYTNIATNSNLNNRPCTAILPMVNNEIRYFLHGPSRESDRKASVKITKQLQKEFEDVFTGIECFDGMFSLQIKPHRKPYQVPPKACSICAAETI